MIIKVPVVVQDYVLSTYVKKCKIKSNLAFSQWRLKYNYIRNNMNYHPYDQTNDELIATFNKIRDF